ncbi:MAG: acyltransferase [Methylocystaceae bacterium]|nr:acyltransferase [Methylocystaceae bacterium]
MFSQIKIEAEKWGIFFTSIMPGALGYKARLRLFRKYSGCPCLGMNIEQFVNVNGWSNISIGNRVNLGIGCQIESLHGTLKIGDNVSINNRVFLDANQSEISIGDNCLIGPNVVIRASNHRFDKSPEILIRKQGHIGTPIIIGEDVWIGANVVITSGCIIGDNVVIGAGSVITKNIPSGSIATGVPARVITTISERNNSIA